MLKIILPLALVLRLVLINQSLWLDEAIEALALMGRMGPIFDYALYDFQPPLYHLIGIVWTKLAGFSEIALRTPSLLAGLGLVYYLAIFARRLAGSKLATIVGLLAATNPLLIYYSQEGRTYMLTAFFLTASYYYLYLLTASPRTQPRAPLLYLLFTTLSLWTSYIAWIAVALQLIYLLIKKSVVPAVLTLTAMMTLIFWLPSLMESLGIGLSTAAHTPEWGRVVGGLSLKALGLTWVKAVIGRISFSPAWLYLAVVMLLFVLHARVLSRLKTIPSAILWWLFTIVPVILISLFIPVYSYFRLLFLVPAYLLLLGLGLTRLPAKWSYLLIALQLVFSGIYFFMPDFHRENWRQLVADFGANSVYALPSLNQNAPLLYYQVPRTNIVEPKSLTEYPAQDIIYVKYVEDVFDLKKSGPANLEAAGFILAGSRVYSGLQVDIYENRD